jgi:hypothetical protein
MFRILAAAPDPTLTPCPAPHPTTQVEVWEHKGDRVRKLKTIDAHTEAVRTLGFVNDGALLLTGSSDRSILALDTATGKPLAKLEHAHKSAVNRLQGVGPQPRGDGLRRRRGQGVGHAPANRVRVLRALRRFRLGHSRTFRRLGRRRRRGSQQTKREASS